MDCPDYHDLIVSEAGGRLEAEARRSLDRHLATCADCRLLRDDLDRIRKAARDLPQSTPPDRLWLQLAGRIRTSPEFRERTGAAGRGPAGATTSPSRWLAVAALLAITVGSTVFVLRMVSSPEDRAPGAAQSTAAPNAAPGATPDDARLVESVETELRMAEAHYEKAIAALEQIATDQDSSLDPEVAATLKRTLQVIDDAIAESRAALGSEPASRVARDSLFEALRRKVGVLQDTIALMNEMRKGNPSGAARIAEGLDKL